MGQTPTEIQPDLKTIADAVAEISEVSFEAVPASFPGPLGEVVEAGVPPRTRSELAALVRRLPHFRDLDPIHRALLEAGIFPILLSNRSAAKLLGVSEGSIRNWQCAGAWPEIIKLGAGPEGPTRTDLFDLLEWLQSRRFSSTTDAKVQLAS